MQNELHALTTTIGDILPHHLITPINPSTTISTTSSSSPRPSILELAKLGRSINRRRRRRTPSYKKQLIKMATNKGPWSLEEDEALRAHVHRYGKGKWCRITEILPRRNGKQARERYLNHLDPSVVKSPWTVEEDEKLLQLVLQFGKRWSLISKKIPGRTDNSCKNRYYSSLIVKNPGAVEELEKGRNAGSVESDLGAGNMDLVDTVLRGQEGEEQRLDVEEVIGLEGLATAASQQHAQHGQGFAGHVSQGFHQHQAQQQQYQGGGSDIERDLVKALEDVKSQQRNSRSR